MSRACVGGARSRAQPQGGAPQTGPARVRGAGRSGVRAHVGSAGPRRAGGARAHSCDMGHMPMGEAESGTTANLTNSFLTDS